MRDQVSKLKKSGLSVCVLKGDHVTKGVYEKENEPLACLLINYQLIFAHPEAVVDNKNVLSI
jgi:superfamily II DNA helicase RecQ